MGASEMKIKFKVDFSVLIKQLKSEEDSKRKNGDACALCGSEKLLFEPPVFYCNGNNCPTKRINRNRYYFVGGNNQYHWCHPCYSDLNSTEKIQMVDLSMKKEQLVKKKNDEVHEESWVACDRCQRCTIEDRKKRGVTEGSSSTPMAEDLQRTTLSEALEMHVRIKVDRYFENAAQEKAKTEKLSMEVARKGMSMGGLITIRQVTSMDTKLDVKERMKKRYGFKNYPSEFNYRSKCIVVFQNLDGVDVILFGLYVYEHDEKNPAPNNRTVYVSYLDSVYYMVPKEMRTIIYHEILISYLDHVRKKGFSTAHIWACPPMQGDYFPSEVESIIKDIEEGKNTKKNSSECKKKKSKSKSKSKSGRGGTRSTGLDEDNFAASGLTPPGYDQKSLEDGGQDYVMAKLGETIKPMKESFIVAFLAWDGAKAKHMVF